MRLRRAPPTAAGPRYQRPTAAVASPTPPGSLLAVVFAALVVAALFAPRVIVPSAVVLMLHAVAARSPSATPPFCERGQSHA